MVRYDFGFILNLCQDCSWWSVWWYVPVVTVVFKKIIWYLKSYLAKCWPLPFFFFLFHKIKLSLIENSLFYFRLTLGPESLSIRVLILCVEFVFIFSGSAGGTLRRWQKFIRVQCFIKRVYVGLRLAEFAHLPACAQTIHQDPICRNDVRFCLENRQILCGRRHG